MVDLARETHPALQFTVGSITVLELVDGELDGLVAWYSVIHTPPQYLPGAFGEFSRVLRIAGSLLLAFQVGDERVRPEEAYVFAHRCGTR